MRSLAEMENLRRRTEREVADARTYGVTSFAREVLAVGDNLQRALDALGPDVRAGADPAIQSLIEGVELTERDLLKALEKHGIKKLTPQGEKFDPNLHQAMYEVPDASVPPGTVVQVVQAGYTIGDRVLRPALVAVAKGGPKVAAEAAGAEAPANDNVGSGELRTVAALLRAEAVAHFAEARIELRPRIAARDADHSQQCAAAEAQPLHRVDVGASFCVLAFQQNLMALLVCDPQWLRARDPHILSPGIWLSMRRAIHRARAGCGWVGAGMMEISNSGCSSPSIASLGPSVSMTALPG